MFTDVSLTMEVRNGALAFLASTGSSGPDAITPKEVRVDPGALAAWVGDLRQRNLDMTDEELTERLLHYVYDTYLSE